LTTSRPAAVARLAGGATTGRLVVKVADDAVVGAVAA
jgi:NADPH2:quinone reductase